MSRNRKSLACKRERVYVCSVSPLTEIMISCNPRRKECLIMFPCNSWNFRCVVLNFNSFLTIRFLYNWFNYFDFETIIRYVRKTPFMLKNNLLSTLFVQNWAILFRNISLSAFCFLRRRETCSSSFSRYNLLR